MTKLPLEFTAHAFSSRAQELYGGVAMRRGRFKTALCFLTGFALLWETTVPCADAQTLMEAVDLAIRTHPEALEALNHRLGADQALKAARGGYLPRVDVNAAIGREHLSDSYSRSLGMSSDVFTRRLAAVTLTQMLFDGFAVRSAVEEQRAR